MYDIFLSYSTQDRERLQPLFHALEQQGWSVFWDHRTIDIGERWSNKINQAIRSSKCIVVVWSDTSVESEWVLEEAHIGKQRDVLLPIRIDDVIYPVGFSMRQTGDFIHWNGDVNNLEFLRLTAKIRELLEEHNAQVRREVEQAAAEQKRREEAEARSQREAAAERERQAREKAIAEQKAREAAQQQGRQEEEKRQHKAAAITERERLEREIAEAEQLAREAARRDEVNKAAQSASLLDGKLLAEPKRAFWKKSPLQIGVFAVLSAVGMAAYMQQTDKGKAESVPASEPKTVPTTPPTQQVAAKSAEPERLPFEPEMVEIPAGKFTMGCVEGRDDVEGGCDDDEKPAHEVSISAFKLAKTEVTVAQFRAFVEATNYKTTAEEKGSCWSYDAKGSWDDVKGNSWKKLGFKQAEDHPVACVSWDDATAYIDWLKKETDKSYRLPTEAEWEYAARAGTKTAYPWGKSIGKNNANCWKDSCGEKFDYTSPIGSFAADPFGLYDMHGNVWEWVQDWKGSYAAEPLEDPKGSSSGSYRVLRGGSWYNAPRHVRSAFRFHYSPGSRNSNVGFRPALGQ